MPVPISAVVVHKPEKQFAVPVPARDPGVPPHNRLLLFFLLLMAIVFGLLVENATTRRQG